MKNLDRIKEVGVDKWLAEQEQQWKCPDCQTASSWYAEDCANCGRGLADYQRL